MLTIPQSSSPGKVIMSLSLPTYVRTVWLDDCRGGRGGVYPWDVIQCSQCRHRGSFCCHCSVRRERERMRSAVYGDVTPCIVVDRYKRFLTISLLQTKWKWGVGCSETFVPIQQSTRRHMPEGIKTSLLYHYLLLKYCINVFCSMYCTAQELKYGRVVSSNNWHQTALAWF
jgi:hypothetical protein